MPEGLFVRRRAENEFKPEYRDWTMKAFNWLNYLNSKGAKIDHHRNGKEVKVDKYRVDGYDRTTNKVYEFHVSIGIAFI